MRRLLLCLAVTCSAASLEARRFIVEFGPGSHATSAKRDELLASQPDIKVLKTFDSPVFSGASVSVVEGSSHDIASLSALPQILRAWPNKRLELSAPVSKRQIAVDPSAADEYAVHWATGVEDVHAEGILGEGVKVGIVDTGVWYNHSALGGGYGPGFKVAGGWDLVGDAWTATADGDEVPDDDPLDQQGHGTHVAGILAGEAPGGGWVGVAPKASLYSYKVFGSDGGTYDDLIIDAFLRAYDEGMDVITASIGGVGGFADDAWAVVADRIVEEGVVVTIAAGNSGSGGPYYASTGSSGPNVLGVASAEVKRDMSTNMTIRQPSYFTSWGGLYDTSVKPDISAPGTNIFSTWFGGDNNEFVLLNGTSMATPYIAGVAALYISKYGGRSVHGPNFAKMLSMRILSTGTSLPWLNYDETANTTFKAPSHQIGGGLVDARKVMNYTTSVQLQRFALNDTANFQAAHSIVLFNSGADTVGYTCEVEPWAGFDMLHIDPNDVSESPRIRYRPEMEPKEFGINVQLPADFKITPGESKTVNFTFDVPQDVDDSSLPAYSGRVLITSDTGEVTAVPYQGLAFDLAAKMQTLMFAGTYPWIRSTTAFLNKTTFTMDLSSEAQDFPKMFMKTNWGSREVRWDIYGPEFDEARDWEYPPVVGKNGHIGSATSWEGSGTHSSFDPSKYDSNQTFAMPVTNVGRNALTSGGYTSTYWWFGKLANGTYIGLGNYTIRFAALLPFMDPSHSDSWTRFETGITILPKNETR